VGAVLSALLKHMGAYVVYVIPPLDADPDTLDYEGYAGFFAVFEGSVDRWSVMTYDANQGTGRPNAPFAWQAGIIAGLAQLTTNRKQLTRVRNKLLMGLPMYGWRSDGEAMTGGALVDWLTGGGQGASVRWNEEAKEHQFSVFTSGGGGKAGHTVTASYPTMSFLCARLRLAEEEGIAGVALWEIGQSLPSLMEAF
jgi:spore germination protein YaaH